MAGESPTESLLRHVSAAAANEKKTTKKTVPLYVTSVKEALSSLNYR